MSEFAPRLVKLRPRVTLREAEAFWKRARAAHEELSKPTEDAFARWTAERLGDDQPLTGLHAADLYLAAGALAADAAAVEKFRALLSRRVTEVLAAMRAPGTLRDEVEDQLLEKMLVANAKKPARLATYGGRGELAAWLGAAATRTAIELKRLKRYADDDGAGSTGQSGLRMAAADPELKLLKASHAARFKKALHEAFAMLEVEDRNLLRMQLADGLTADELASIFQVHRATAARRAAKAREVLVQRVREVLQEKYGMSEESITSDLRALGPELDVSLSRLLGSARAGQSTR